MKKILYILVLSLLVFFVKTEVFDDQSVPDTIKGHATILFVGDIMFDRSIRAKAEAAAARGHGGYGFLFSCIQDYLGDFDLVVANLEGPVTDGPSQSLGTIPGQPGNTSFTFSPNVVSALFDNNVRMVSLGNNHAMDRGREGAQATERYLEQGGIGYFGSPLGSTTAFATMGDYKVAFINFNQFLGMDNPHATAAQIRSARPDADVVFVYTHWGDEYVAATDYQKTLAHQFIDAGADVVIGSHSHVIQEHEVYKGKDIFYSLGNFIFDQYFSDEVRTGGGVEATISKDGITVSERRFNSGRDGRTCLVGN